MKILILNGPNLNLLGQREKNIYGNSSYDEMVNKCGDFLDSLGIGGVFFQSNSEGELIDKIQSAIGKFDGIVFNPGAFTHTSTAIPEAVKLTKIPTVEVHVSALELREGFRQTSYIRDIAIKTFSGMGIDGYVEALKYLVGYIGDKK